jgi:uncharacterized membrane protein
VEDRSVLYSPLLPVHITAGILGILSGSAAMSFRKGSSRHVLAGRVFVVSMLTMAAAAVYLAVHKHLSLANSQFRALFRPVDRQN